MNKAKIQLYFLIFLEICNVIGMNSYYLLIQLILKLLSFTTNILFLVLQTCVKLRTEN